MKRQIAAFVMLAVFLPILLLSSIHVHDSAESAEVTCVDCLHNHCGGHLTQTTVHLDDCVLCQFLTLPMFVAVAVVVALVLKKGVRLYAMNHGRIVAVACGVISLRGPPVCLKK
jgi:hypothetical protein